VGHPEKRDENHDSEIGRWFKNLEERLKFHPPLSFPFHSGDGMKRMLFLFVVVAILFVSGCVQQSAQTQKSAAEIAKDRCIETCMTISSDLSNRSPCLSDGNPEWNVSDWVCDVAHSPRQAIDDLPENQCLAFREGRSHHFVEVSPYCEFIRAY